MFRSCCTIESNARINAYRISNVDFLGVKTALFSDFEPTMPAIVVINVKTS